MAKIRLIILAIVLSVCAFILIGCASIPIPSKIPILNDIPIIGVFL